MTRTEIAICIAAYVWTSALIASALLAGESGVAACAAVLSIITVAVTRIPRFRRWLDGR